MRQTDTHLRKRDVHLQKKTYQKDAYIQKRGWKHIYTFKCHSKEMASILCSKETAKYENGPIK